MSDKINLEEILDNHSDVRQYYPIICILAAMKEACRQTLALAAGEASIIKKKELDDDYYEVNKKAILDVINLIE